MKQPLQVLWVKALNNSPAGGYMPLYKKSEGLKGQNRSNKLYYKAKHLLW